MSLKQIDETTTGTEWDDKREIIQDLYLTKRMTLKQVIEIMKTRHNFCATKAQYERRFKHWGFRKNLTSSKWKYIDYKLSKRKREGNESDVYIDGKLVPKKRIRKERSRNFVPTIEKYRPAPSPKTPEGFSIRTPSPPPPVRIPLSLGNLPWFKFQNQFRKFLKAQGVEFKPYSAVNDIPASSLTTAEHDIYPAADDSSLYQHWNHPQSSYTIDSPSIGNPMDDLHPSFTTASSSISISNNAPFKLHIGDLQFNAPAEVPSFMDEPLLNFSMSNPAIFRTPRTTLGLPDLKRTVESVGSLSDFAQLTFLPRSLNWSTGDSDKNIQAMHSYLRNFTLERHDGEIQEAFRIIREPACIDKLLHFLNYIINLVSNNLLSERKCIKIVQWIDQIQGGHQLLASLLSINSPTAKAFASNLLAGALRTKNASITRIILKAGTNPNSPMGYSKNIPLQYVSKHGGIEVAQVLLKAGANVNALSADYNDTLGETMQTALQAATQEGNIELVQILLKAGADVNAPLADWDRRTALQAATQKGNIELVQILLKAGADVNAPPAAIGGRTALQAATQKGNIELVLILLKAGADVNAPPASNSGRTALQAAAQEGNIELVQILLKTGADVNAPAGRQTALQAAIQKGNIELVPILLKTGADVNAPPAVIGGRTALQAAAQEGNIKLVQILLGAGADVNAPLAAIGGRTALQAATQKGNIELVLILLKAGADVNALPASNGGWTALQAAAQEGNIELVQILLKTGADVNAPAGRQTALQAAIQKGNIELVKILLDAGADVNTPPASHHGRTALQAAAQEGNIALVTILLDASADVNAPPALWGGRTALQAAAQEGNIELVLILLKAGADVNAPPASNSGRTALQAAAQKGNIELVIILLDAGADVNAPPAGNSGRTALQAAAQEGNIELVKILLDTSADINAPPAGYGGVTAIQVAAILGHIRMAQLLLNAGADVNAAPAIDHGRTALEGAAEHGRIDMLQLLLNAGADTKSPQCTQYKRALKFAAEYGRDAVCELLKAHHKTEVLDSNTSVGPSQINASGELPTPLDQPSDQDMSVPPVSPSSALPSLLHLLSRAPGAHEVAQETTSPPSYTPATTCPPVTEVEARPTIIVGNYADLCPTSGTICPADLFISNNNAIRVSDPPIKPKSDMNYRDFSHLENVYLIDPEDPDFINP